MSQSQSHYEIEIKYRLKDPRALRTRLKKLGAKKLGVDSERNELYDDAAGGLKKRGCALRVRQTQSDKALLTYKGPVSKGPVKRRLEIETDADPAAIRRILVYLGFQPKLRYDKVRETYGLRSCLVTIDRLKGHGFFSEIEGPRAAILKLEKALGFEVRDREDRTYAQIVKIDPEETLMSDLEDNYEFFCPYCRASNTLNVDRSGGSHQSFTIDCEMCCKPIEVEVEIDWEGEVSYDVKQEDE